jgi:pyridinium-3,5-biscarboxylic acid mononucleotide sulfurtransferase
LAFPLARRPYDGCMTTTGMTSATAPGSLDAKRAALHEYLRATGGLMVAFSGGADSAFLLAAAVRALGARALAATGVSPSLPRHELDDARAFAAELGARHLVVATHEQDRPGYLRNGRDRCYFCKSELFDVLGPLAAAEGLTLATGTNTDDLGDWRPGLKAGAEHGVVTPLVEAGFSKADVRAASRAMGLRTWDKPAAACLASRVAYGLQVTPARLSRVERAEVLLRSLGLRQLRVRDHGDLARVEVPLEDLPHLVEPEARERVVSGLRDLGFTHVTLDLEGFRSGSMNRA